MTILHEEGPWRLKDRKSPFYKSWIYHSCKEYRWTTCLQVEIFYLKYCSHCNEPIPPSILTLWTLHNWDTIPLLEDSYKKHMEVA